MKMKKSNYLFVLSAIAIAVFILFVSLQSANQNQVKNTTTLVSGKFYVAREILPDHSLYPLLMTIDRLRLELASAEKRPYLLVAYSNRRLFYSQKLLEKGDRDLAFVTLNKALKYMSQALSEIIFLFEKTTLNKKTEYQVLAFFVLENFDQQLDFFVKYRDQFSNEEKVLLESLFLENSVLAEKVRSLLK